MSGDLKYAIVQAVFIQTDTPDYAETTIPFKNLEEMVAVCSKRHPNLTLERILVYVMAGGEPCSLTAQLHLRDQEWPAAERPA